MAIKPLNSVAGFSVGEAPSTVVIYANGDVTTTNITTTGVSNLNSVGNVKITGGSAGQVLSTDGSGNLSFVTIGTASLNNGTSNVSVLNSGNILFSVAGNANVVTITGTGINVSGTLNATGNANVGNLAGTQLFASANVIAPQFVSNVATGTAPLVVSSTTLVSNLNADLLDGYNTAVANTASTVVVRDANGNVSANYFIGDGSQLTGIDTSLISNGTSNVKVLSSGNVTVSISGNSNVVTFTGNGANIDGYADVTGNLSAGNISANIANLTTANVTGNVVAGGVKTDNLYYANGNPWDLQQPAGSNNEIQFNSNGSFGASANFTFNDATQLLSVTGNVAATNIYANSGIIGAQTLKGEGGNISNIQGANVSGTVATATTAGTVTTAAQPNITSTGVLTELVVANTVYADGYAARTGSDLTISTAGNGNLIFSVAGTGIVNFNGARISNVGNANVGNIGATNGVFTNVSGNGANLSSITGANVTGTVANATYAVSAGTAGTVTTAAQPNITSVGTLSSLAVTGNVSAGNVDGGNLVSANYITGTLTTAAQPNITSVGTLSSLDVTANVTAGNVYANSGTVGADTITATGNVSGNNLSATNQVVAGNGLQVTTGALTVLSGNLDVTGNINVTGNLNYSNVTDLVVGDPLIYIGANNTGDLYDLGIVGSYNEGTYYHTGVARNAADNYWTFFDGVVAEPTTVIDWANATYPTVKMGNLLTTSGANIGGIANITGNVIVGGTLDVTGIANLTNVSATAASFTANVTAGNIYANSGTIGATLLAGTLTTAAQPNITSVGTLTSLAVTGNANVGGIANIVGNAIVGGGVTATGNVVAGNVYANSGIIAAQTLKGEGGNISNIQGANVSGAVATATTAGTVTTAAQPNITSVGTLTSLSVTGNISAGNVSATNGNLTTANVSGNIVLGESTVTWATATTTATTANQTIASFSSTGITGVEFLVKGVDSTGSKYSVATVQAVTDGTNVDYSTFGGVNLGGYTGSLAVNIVGGQIRLQVTPASSNSTVWTTQYRLI